MSRRARLTQSQKAYVLMRFEEAAILKEEISAIKDSFQKGSSMRESFKTYAAAVKEYRKSLKKLLTKDKVFQKEMDHMTNLGEVVVDLKDQLDTLAIKHLAVSKGQSLTVH